MAARATTSCSAAAATTVSLVAMAKTSSTATRATTSPSSAPATTCSNGIQATAATSSRARPARIRSCSTPLTSARRWTSPPMASGGGQGDGASDTVKVNGTGGDDHISIASSGASVVVNGLAAQVTIAGAEPDKDSLVVNGAAGNDT